MTTTRRRTRRDRSSPAPAAARPPAPGVPSPPPLPEWKWRTFPVYFAFSFALFVGIYVGLLTAAVSDAGNSGIALIVAGIPAIMLGLGLSRMVTRFFMRRGIVKPRPKRK